MACRGCFECLLKLLNFVLTVAGLAMVGYGVYLLVEWNKVSSGGGEDPVSPVSDNPVMLTLGRPMLLVVPVSTSFADQLPKAWFIYLFIGIGVILFIISCCGCVGAATRNGCCLSSVVVARIIFLVGIRIHANDNFKKYSFLVILLILVELAAVAFIFFDHSWKDAIPADKTGDFDMIYNFLKKNWKIAKWVALGAVILEALAFLLTLMIRAANQPADYDSDDEYIAPRSAIRQPLINRQGLPPSGVPSLDHRPSRNDAWSQRMREKYGLDTSEFTYNLSDPSRFQQATLTSAEERGRCTIL